MDNTNATRPEEDQPVPRPAEAREDAAPPKMDDGSAEAVVADPDTADIPRHEFESPIYTLSEGEDESRSSASSAGGFDEMRAPDSGETGIRDLTSEMGVMRKRFVLHFSQATELYAPAERH